MFAGNPDDWLNIQDIRKAARRRSHRMVFDYIDGGSDDERTLAQNRCELDTHSIHQRVLTGNDAPDPTVDVLPEDILGDWQQAMMKEYPQITMI